MSTLRLTGRTRIRWWTSPPRDSDGISYRSELIASVESGPVESVVWLERDSEKGSVRFHFKVLLQTAIARQFPVYRHKVGNLKDLKPKRQSNVVFKRKKTNLPRRSRSPKSGRICQMNKGNIKGQVDEGGIRRHDKWIINLTSQHSKL